MTLVVEMDDLDKEEFMIRCRRRKTDASKVTRELIKKWMKENPDTPKIRQPASVS